MATTNKYLTYVGDVRALTTFGNELVFTTIHPDGKPTALYRLDVTKLELSEVALPCGGRALTASNDTLCISGDDSQIYQWTAKSKSVSALKAKLSEPAIGFATAANDRLAAVCGAQLVIVDAKKGTETQSFELPERGSALAVDSTGEWLVVGTQKGHVSVYCLDDDRNVQLSESEKLHEGVVTSLLFEPDELRFFSAGADQKLLLTHARGKLEPEDRGRGNSHKDHVTAMLHVPGDRFVSVSRDRTAKTWARAGATRPATLDDGIPAVVDATMIEIHGRPHLIVAGEDNTLRFILLDAGGRFGGLTTRIYDAYDRAAHLLKENDVAQRGDALHALASYDDSRAVEMLAKQVEHDADHALRLRACELLTKSSHPRATKLLEPLLKHNDDKVRIEAFTGLRKSTDKSDLRPLELAIASQHVNVAVAAIKESESLAKKDDLPRQLLIQTLDKDPADVRRAALLSLENVFPKDSPEPGLIALKSGKPDTRRLALIRSYQRDLLADSRISGAVRRAGEDDDADVRRTAFLVGLLSREKLTKAIRERDAEIHRQLFELENFEVEPTKGKKAKEPPKTKATKLALDTTDYEPLLSAMSSRVMDTCLLGARCLALLGDARAFGTLLQLSREEDAAARVQVCQALAALDDERAAQRLETLANDPDEAVRDAAYTALEEIYQKEPLDAADVGLGSSHVEIRRRALKTLSSTIRKSKKKLIDERARQMMLRALNDHEDSVNGEAFKTSLGLKVDGSPDAALRFALTSVRSNVRREVLTEAMAHDKQEWAQQLLTDLLNDAAPKIRADAYDHLLSKRKGRDIVPMQAALQSRHTDIRLRATQSLSELKTEASQKALVIAIEDDEADVRRCAVNALIASGSPDVVRAAMSSQHRDVRLSAARVRALFQDEATIEPLIEIATAPEPENDADKTTWSDGAVLALGGLELIGKPEVVDPVLPLLHGNDDAVRAAAAKALATCARPHQADTLKPLLQESDAQVRFRAALGLAFCQDPVALPVVFSDEAASVLNEQERLAAAIAYGELTENQLASVLDSDDAAVRNAALFVLLARDWREHDGTPSRILTALSAAAPRLRLVAAEALEAFANPQGYEQFMVDFINDRGEDQAWDVSTEQVSQLASMIVFAEPQCQAYVVEVLTKLNADTKEEWDFSWHVATTRYPDEPKRVAKTAEEHKLPTLQTSDEELRQLAFGTYVGLVREQGSYHQRGRRPAFGSTVIGVRQTAMRRLIAMAQSDEGMAAATRPVLIQALSDDVQAVRTLAFEQLAALGVDDEARAAAAIECGHTDLAVAALKLLSGGSAKEGRKVLADVVLTRDDELAAEAGALLLRMTDAVTAAKAGLESPHRPTRLLAVGWLVSAYDDDPKAKKALADAYQSRHVEVQRQVACELAEKKDERAFDMLVEQLALATNRSERFKVVNGFGNLGDKRSSDVLLTTLEDDIEKKHDTSMLFSFIGSARHVEIADRLLPLLEKETWRKQVAQALVRISGYDQPITDPEDELPNRKWMDEQHPRHDDVFARYLEKCLELNLPDLIKPQIAGARWSLTDAVDDVLKLLAVHPDDDLRNQVIEAIGWRLKERNGPAEALVDALGHRDTMTKFYAAEGLARGGKDDGINILLSSVELMTDLHVRVRATAALGELGDERALDMLLRLATEDGHALQSAAAEAIGHLGKSSKSDEIFELLRRLAKSPGSVASRAIVGLRWFDTSKGWDLIREQARSDASDQYTVVEQLGYNDTPETRQLLIDLLKGYWTGAALPAAKRLFGDESLEPDYAAVQSVDGYYDGSYIEETYHCLQRVCDDGDAAKLFEVLEATYCTDEVAAALLQRDPPPIKEAVAVVESPHGVVVETAAAIIGRVGEKENAKKLGAAIDTWIKIWNEQWKQARIDGWYSHDCELAESALKRLAWAAGRTGAGKSQVIGLLETNQDVSEFTAVRRAAAFALVEIGLTKAELKKLEGYLHDDDAVVRRTVTALVAAKDTKLAGSHVNELLSDRRAFQIVRQHDVTTKSVAVASADDPQYQAIVLPQLVDDTEVKRLSEVAIDTSLVESLRLGAVEGLAKMASTSANKELVRVGKSDDVGEEIQKAAWRGLRRAKRRLADEAAR